MTDEQKAMIDRVCETILEDEGRVFCMELWIEENPGTYEYIDEIITINRIPRCGTVSCIGGTLARLGGFENPINVFLHELAPLIGLTVAECEGLFFHYLEYNGVILGTSVPRRWPKSFAKEYAEAGTALDKAKVAVRLLQKIKEDGDGRCLHFGDPGNG